MALRDDRWKQGIAIMSDNPEHAKVFDALREYLSGRVRAARKDSWLGVQP